MAGEFLLANFPPGYWSTPALTSTTDSSNTAANTYYTNMAMPAPGSFQIVIKANVQVPLIFARIFNVSNAGVAAVATSTRRSSRIMYVLDRSGSMSSLWPSLQTTAIQYAGWASPGVDELGLVVFGPTGVVAYPNYTKTSASPYQGYISPPNLAYIGTANVPNTGGPDTNFIDTVNDTKRDGKSGCTDMLCMIYQSATGGNTGMSEALDLAYLELQKSHLRDLAADGSDGRLNTVVFFTDGVPNQVTVYANDPNNPSWLTPCTGACKTAWTSSCHCTNCANETASVFSGAGDNRMVYAAGTSTDPTSSSGNVPSGPFQLAESDTANTTLQWAKQTNSGGNGEGPVNFTSASHPGIPNTCGSSTTASAPWIGLAQIPTLDFYNTSTIPRLVAQDSATPGYKNSNNFNYYSWKNLATDTDATSYGSKGNPATKSFYYWGVAAWNAVDNIGYNMRIDSNQAGRGDGTNVADVNKHMAITIFSIGYLGDGGVDAPLLKRLANTTDAPGYVSDGSQQTGKYYPASDISDIAAAMGDIMSSVLRLAQ